MGETLDRSTIEGLHKSGLRAFKSGNYSEAEGYFLNAQTASLGFYGHKPDFEGGVHLAQIERDLGLNYLLLYTTARIYPGIGDTETFNAVTEPLQSSVNRLDRLYGPELTYEQRGIMYPESGKSHMALGRAAMLGHVQSDGKNHLTPQAIFHFNTADDYLRHGTFYDRAFNALQLARAYKMKEAAQTDTQTTAEASEGVAKNLKLAKNLGKQALFAFHPVEARRIGKLHERFTGYVAYGPDTWGSLLAGRDV